MSASNFDPKKSEFKFPLNSKEGKDTVFIWSVPNGVILSNASGFTFLKDTFDSPDFKMYCCSTLLSWIFRLKFREKNISVYLALLPSDPVFMAKYDDSVFAKYDISILKDGFEVYAKASENNFSVTNKENCFLNPKGFDQFISTDKLKRLFPSNTQPYSGFKFGDASISSRVVTQDFSLSFRCEIEVEFLGPQLRKSMRVPPCTLLENIGNLLKSGDFSDVILCAGDQEFRVHKCILSQQSKEFKAIFQRDIGEKVVVKDMDPKTLQILLDHIYTGSVDMNMPSVIKILRAARTYSLPRLKAACEKKLAESLTIENAIETLQLADDESAFDLERATVEYIAEFPEEIIGSEKWNLLCKNSYLIGQCFTALATKKRDKGKKATKRKKESILKKATNRDEFL